MPAPADDRATGPTGAASPAPDREPAPALESLSPLEREVLAALALGAAPRTRGWLQDAMKVPALRAPGTLAPSQDQMRLVMQNLQATHCIVGESRRIGFWGVTPRIAARVYRELLDRVDARDLRDALAHADQHASPSYGSGWQGPRHVSIEALRARLRLELFTGSTPSQVMSLLRPMHLDADDERQLVDDAVAELADDTLFEALHPDLQCGRLAGALAHLVATLNTGLDLSPARVVERARARVAAAPVGTSAVADLLRVELALYLLLAAAPAGTGNAWQAEIEALLADESLFVQHEPGLRAALLGAVHARRAEWAQAEARVEEGLAARRKATGKRRGLLPASVSLLYVQALLAQGGAARLDKALKYCLAEGGKREPALDTPLGYVSLALKMRMGDMPRHPEAFRPHVQQPWDHRPTATRASPQDLPRWLMRAWLKDGPEQEPLSTRELEAAERLGADLRDAGLAGLAAQLDAALQVLAGQTAPVDFFVRSGVERWQAALQALAAIAEPAAGAPGPAGAGAEPETRIVWVLELGADGHPLELQAQEQKRGTRGWGKPKEIPLSRLQRAGATVLPRDAPVVNALRQEPYGRAWRLDLASALAGLVGHPFVAFHDSPEQFVTLTEGAASLDVVDQGERLRVRIQPSLRVTASEATPRWAATAERERELDALRAVTVWRDSPSRARLIRLSPAQKRVAQLLGPEGLEIPRRGAEQLQQVLASLGSHFQIHADDAVQALATREVPAESRLRAELQPVGPGLQVRLLAAPFGQEHAAHGPRLVPGRGRARLVTTLDGETLGVNRDLALERRHLDDVLDACPMLLEPGEDAPCEWQLDAPDDALALVERLHQHHAIAALDWPQGRPIRVQPAALDQLMLKVRTGENWLAVQGELKVDEELVVSLQQLIAVGASSRSRFVPLGEGRFVALTQELRERIDDLAVVAEQQAGIAGNLAELRVPTVAAPWLQAAALGARTEYDAGYARQLRRLDEARTVVPAVPSTLQAQLRPYQEEGFEWAMRLAHAGLGGCLADDMGLGKTLQALAVLLSRAAGGPALVVAPTSLMGNWRAEAARFAPSLNVIVHAESGAAGERTARIASLGSRDVLLVSYPMLWIDGEHFAARPWHTLVLDEAQAIKNASAKRSQAVFALRADFRLALSGTPIENRLGELWSIMRACNPGLLGSMARFNERFANLIERQHDRHAQRTLRRLIGPFLLRRTKAEVLADLPPRTELVLKIQPDEAERAHYEALRREVLVDAEKSLSGDGAGQAHLNILAGLTRLRRAACDPRLVSPQLKMAGAKVQAFAELAQELVANGHKALVFSQFVDFLKLLREPLDAAGIAYQHLDGSTPAAERTRRVDAFQAGEGHLFLISLKAGGFGLNLTVADYVVIADPWWNPAAEDQASGRAHRIGQQRPVTVYRLVAQGTLEERIVDMHAAKRELADSVLEGGDLKALPSADELLALMRDEKESP